MKHRRLLIAVAVVVLLPVLAVAALVAVAKSEWGERWLEARVSAALDREVQIEGVGLRWGLPPGVVFAKLRIANPPWAQTKNLVDAEGLYARVRVAPLFVGKVVVPYLGARRAEAGLEMDGDRATWKFNKEQKNDSPSRLLLAKVYLDDGHIRFIDRNEATDLEVDVKGSAGEGGELRATAKGSFRGQPTTAKARVPGLSTQHETTPLEVDGSAVMGRTSASVAGTFSGDARSLDMKVRLAGQNLKDLSKVTGVVLPESPPYNVAGRLRHEGDQWIFDPFDGKVGDSDLRGALTYAKPAKGKPSLVANVKAKLLDFDDLGPLIGAPPKTGAGESAAPEQQAQAAQRQATARLLPEKPLGVESWARMDADVTLVAEKIQRPKALPLEAFSTHLVLKDSVLRLEPLKFGMAGGNIVSTVTLDARQKPMQGDIKADIKGLQLGRLFPTSKTMQDALGTLYGRAELKGQGQSVAQLLGTSNGKASAVIEGGRAAEFLVELAELDVAQVVMLLGKRNEQEELRCAVAGFDVQDGLAKADSFVIDTEGTAIRVDGAINLANETLDLAATPNAKHSSFVSLRTPLHLEGPLRKPKVRPEAGPLVRKGAIAVGLAAINPALAVFALYEPARGKDQPCAQLIAEAKAKGAGKAKTPDANPARAAEDKREADAKVRVSQAPGAPGKETVAEKK